MIILEGPDNSGKSSLAAELGLTYRHPGPAPINDAALDECLATQLSIMRSPIVHDRVTCISHQIYNPGWFLDPKLLLNLRQMIECEDVLFIYCRPPESHMMNFAHHKAKDYDTEEHIKKVIDNQHKYIAGYDELFDSIPHVVYDFTDQDMFRSNFIELVVKFAHGETRQIKNFLIGG